MRSKVESKNRSDGFCQPIQKRWAASRLFRPYSWPAPPLGTCVRRASAAEPFGAPPPPTCTSGERGPRGPSGRGTTPKSTLRSGLAHPLSAGISASHHRQPHVHRHGYLDSGVAPPKGYSDSVWPGAHLKDPHPRADCDPSGSCRHTRKGVASASRLRPRGRRTPKPTWDGAWVTDSQ